MKKFLALLLVLVMCVGVLAACKKTDDTPAGPTLDQAKEYLFSIMKSNNGLARPNDYDVVGKVIIDGTSFEVTWTTDNENITVKPSAKANLWTIDLPDVNDTEATYTLTATIKAADGSTTTVSFTPVLPVINNTGVTTDPEAGVAYKIFFEQANLGYTLFALNTTQDNANKFINSTLDPKAAADFYVEVVDGGFKIYTEINGVKNYVHATATPKTSGSGYTKTIGFATETDCVFFYDSEVSTYKVTIGNEKFGVGTYNAFETISISEAKYFTADKINVEGGQFPIGFMTKAYAETLAPDTKPEIKDPAADSTLTIAEAIALGQTKIKEQYTEGKYYVTGQVKEIQKADYGNLVITDGTNDLLVYGTYDATGANRYDAMANPPQVGDTITVYGIIGMYNAPQMKDGWVTAWTAGEGGGNQGGAEGGDDTTETLGVVDAPVAGTAYKFGMVQGKLNDGKVYFLKGGMDGFYMATSSNANEAIDVYLEETEGGYYLYTLSGETKTYINMVVNDTHVNGAYEATASTVYTFDAESKTLIATVNDTPYWFGTRNDKTYTTVGPCATSYNGFYCQFYAAGSNQGGNEGGNGGNEGGNEGGNTATEVTIPEALAAADGTAIIVRGIVCSVSEWNTQYGNNNVTIKDADGNTLYAYRLATKVSLGDEIVITGTMTTYTTNNTRQVDAGATAEIVNAHGDNHVYEGGVCTLCGAVNMATGSVSVSKSHNDMATIAGVTVGQNTGVVDGTAIALDDHITVQFDKANAGTAPCIYSSGVRLYQNGATMTIKADGATMTTIVITTADNYTGGTVLTVTGGTISSSGGILTITVDEGATEVVITTGAEKANRLYVANIEVIYTEE